MHSKARADVSRLLQILLAGGPRVANMGLACPECSTLWQFKDWDPVHSSYWCSACKKLIAPTGAGSPHADVGRPERFSLRIDQRGGLHIRWHALMVERPSQDLLYLLSALITGLVAVSIAGRVLTVRSGPFWLLRRVVEGANIRQFCIDVSARPFFERDRGDFSTPHFDVIACTRRGERVRVGRKLETAGEAVWLAGALTWALDIAEPPAMLPTG
ncbi:MAG: hypothetical protein L0Y64_20825 [Myxococcaceae bacterium]|nr:hypothetical protein [Myxococcaceae bacterium]